MITRHRQDLTALLAAGVLGLGAAACGDDGDDPEGVAGADTTSEQREADAQGGTAEHSVEQPQPVTGGMTTLRLDSTTLGVLNAVGLSIEPTGAAELADGRLTFPIREGSVDVDTLSGSIEHEGGLRFSAGGRSLDADELVLRPGKGVLEAQVAGRRVPLLGVDVRALQTPTSDTIVLPGTAAVLSPETIQALEDQLGIRLPGLDLPLGRLQVSGES